MLKTKVDRDEFFSVIGQQNVHPRIVSSWPYCNEWRLQAGDRRLIGVSQEQLKNSKYLNGLTETIYYLMQ
jgi:hypothetical protein